MDQLFSILASQFKRDILTVDSLKSIIKNSPIIPKPSVETMFQINDWRGFVENSMWPLMYHTRYNSFKIVKEEGEVKLRCKRLPQSPEYGPKNGLKLLKDELDLKSPVGSADFRIESLDLDHLKQYIVNQFQSLPFLDRLEVISTCFHSASYR